jgi:hypothetical protein
MADIPFHECAVARFDEGQDARERLLASLEELRSRADTFLAVAESTATVFAVLARATAAHAPPVDPIRRPVDDRDSPVTPGPTPGGRSHHRPAPSTPGSATSPYPDDAGRGVIQVRTSAADLRAVTAAGPRAIVSPDGARGTARTPFSFTVATTGSPVRSITEKGELPRGLGFTDNGDGTATIAGRPTVPGVFRVTVKARFGDRTRKYVVSQALTLMIVAHD